MLEGGLRVSHVQSCGVRWVGHNFYGLNPDRILGKLGAVNSDTSRTLL